MTSEMRLATETPEYIENIRAIRRIVTRIEGSDDAIHFNGETVHMDVWQMDFPETWEPLYIDGHYWGHCKWAKGSDRHRSILWWAKDTEVVIEAHDHLQSESAVVISGQLFLTVGGRKREYGPSDTATVDKGVPHAVTLIEGGIVQLTWLK